LSYNPVSTFCPAAIDACGSWRFFYPKLWIPGARFLFTEGPPPLDEVSEADVVVVQRMMLEGNMRWLNVMRQLGVKIIYDLDDDLWRLPKANNAKRFFEKKETIDGLENCAEWADAFTVSTPTLQKVVKRQWGHVRNVVTKKPIPVLLCENRVPLSLYCLQEGISKEHEEVVIGWSGSNTHAGDLADLWQIVYNILESYSCVRFEVVGQPPPELIRRHPRTRIRPWCHIAEYPARQATWNWDIVLAPLEEHRFNKSKSGIRMQEAGALKRPCLATDITPYAEFVEKGSKELKYLLCNTTRQWEKKLRELVENAALRKELGEAMLQNVKDNFRVELSVPQWLEAIETAYAA
jgi:glycosyltransferase involved in cell wall biosynthesis